MFIWFLGIVGWIVGSFMVGQIVFWIGLLVMPIYSVLLVYYNLAPKKMIFTFMKETTAIVILRGDQFDKILIAQKDHIIDPKTWDISEEKGAKAGFFGGLIVWGFPPFQTIGKYKQRWSHLLENGTVKEYYEELDYVSLKTDFYVFEIPITEKNSAQDINGVSIDVKLVVPMRIINPYEALFLPQRWLAAISGLIKPILKRFVAKFRYKEDLLDMMAGRGIEGIQKEKGIVKEENGEILSENKMGDNLKDKFWEELEKVFSQERPQAREYQGKYLRAYGVLIQRKGTDIFEIDTSEEYKKMVTAEYEAEQKAKMTVIAGKAEGAATSNKVITPVWNIAKQLAGIKKEDEKLTKKEKEKISSYLDPAWSNFLENKAIESVKPTDKVIITEGKGVGKTVARDTAREAIRQEVSVRNKKEEEKDN